MHQDPITQMSWLDLCLHISVIQRTVETVALFLWVIWSLNEGATWGNVKRLSQAPVDKLDEQWVCSWAVSAGLVLKHSWFHHCSGMHNGALDIYIFHSVNFLPCLEWDMVKGGAERKYPWCVWIWRHPHLLWKVLAALRWVVFVAWGFRGNVCLCTHCT